MVIAKWWKKYPLWKNMTWEFFFIKNAWENNDWNILDMIKIVKIINKERTKKDKWCLKIMQSA